MRQLVNPEPAKRPYERRGHNAAEERARVAEIQQLRAQGNYEEADGILGDLLKAYEYLVDSTVEWLVQSGEDKEDSWFAARAVLAKIILAYNTTSDMYLSNFIGLCFNGGVVKGYLKEAEDQANATQSRGAKPATGVTAEVWEDQVADEYTAPIDVEKVLKYLRTLVRRLPEKQRYVIKRRYNLDKGGGATAFQIASELDVSPQAVRALERNAIRNLRLMSLGHPLLTDLDLGDEDVESLLKRLGGRPFGGGYQHVGKRRKKQT